jgi:uncharacterized damage-inducible protein DinB
VQTQQVVNSFTSLHATLLHLWDAESICGQRLKLQEQVVRPSDEFKGDTNAVLKALLDSSKQWAEWVQDAQPHMLKHEFIYQNTKREKFKQPGLSDAAAPVQSWHLPPWATSNPAAATAGSRYTRH